ncbi:hypothetical protein MKX01_036471 [Papaver californicum]|nr:hypothetical protein MKX01_036471 [Papaver californicum]
MELVGKAVKKEFLGFGIFTGIVRSFDPITRLFDIVYEDGDSEEMEFEEVSPIVVEEEGLKESCGSEMIQTRKRVRGEQERDLIEEVQVNDERNHGEFSKSLNKKVRLVGENSMVTVSFDGNLTDCVPCIIDGLSENLNNNVKLKANGCVDLGLNENDVMESADEFAKRDNDLNYDLGFLEEIQTEEFKVDEDFMKIKSIGFSKVIQEKGNIDFGQNMKRDAEVDSEEDIDLGGNSKRNDSVDYEISRATVNSIVKFYPKTDEERRGLDSADKEEPRSKKRKKSSGNMKATKEMVLRRSSRRTNSTNSLQNVLTVEESSAVDISLDTDKISIGLHTEGFREQNLVPSKMELPLSSKNLNLDEIHILDFFSVYSCLRSFSAILFLSPFTLEAFSVAVNNKFPNSLIDSIHMSILRTLKLQMEFLSSEGSQSASNCLRSLNWELLDLVTWPVYMVEYLLIHGSELKPGYELSRLKLLNSDYYKQSPNVKLEILHCLCDDLLEAEVIRLELNRRNVTSEHDADIDRISNSENHKKRKHLVNGLGSSGLTEVIVDEINDWNSDECCLCKMDGSLICCDGCPAAYHSRCVGVVKDLLPEGDWYCPECVMDKHYSSMKSSKSLRGAELLGVDPYGRLFFSSCSYLLVSDSCETTESSNYYYHRDDLDAVIEVLRSSSTLYSGIINAISINWNTPFDSKAKDHLNFQTPTVHRNLIVDSKPKPSEISAMNEVLDGQSCKFSSQSIRRPDSSIAIQVMDMRSPFRNSEGSTEISQGVEGIQMPVKNEADCANKSFADLNYIGALENTNPNIENHSLEPAASTVEQKQNTVAADPASANMVFKDDYYVNYYSFAHISASIAGQLLSKSSGSIVQDPKKSDEEFVAEQMNLIFKNMTRFSWSSIYTLPTDADKESCGWCFSCRSTDSEDCLFSVTAKHSVAKGFGIDFSSIKNKESHLTAVIHHILSIEERLSGLLLGPWHNPHYSKHWRRNVAQASSVASLRNLLVRLESNLRHIALSADWFKVVDSVVTMGSASYAMTKGQVSSSKNGGGKKRGKLSLTETNSTLNGGGRSGVFWWRGGRVSRQVFHCKILPQFLAVKSGRQAGCGKIPTILYLDNSESARRIRYTAWRAAAEMSTTVTQLACQVREFDSNIRWDEIENAQLLSLTDKEYKKSWRLFKKVTIRRKCVEGANVKYLLDFGKRRTIPDSVIQHGVMLELSASERKKYWLDELYVPLSILKAFEEKKLARIHNKTDSAMLREEAGKVIKRTSRKRGLSYLLSKSENHQCGQCKKDLLVREAVSCNDCKGFFHKKHFRKSKGKNAADCTYTCNKCQSTKHVKKFVKIKKKMKKGKPLAQEKITSLSERPRRSIQRVNYVELQKQELDGTKKHTPGHQKQGITKKNTRGRPRKWVPVEQKVQHKKVIVKKKKRGRPKKWITKKHEEGRSKKVVCWPKGNRTQIYHAFWLNGLRFSSKPNDARVMEFREGRLLLPSENSNALCTQPICGLCLEADYTPRLIYVKCDKCQEWFHGDAFGCKVESTTKIIGFRCHKCRESSPPVCPHMMDIAISCNINEGECRSGAEYVVKELPDIDEFSNGKDERHEFTPSDGCQGLIHTYVRKARSDTLLNSNHKVKKATEVPDSNKSIGEEKNFISPHQTLMISEYDVESKEGTESVEKQESRTVVPDSVHEDQKVDMVLDCDDTPSSKACMIESENEHFISVGSPPGTINFFCATSEDVIEKEVSVVGHNEVEDGIGITPANPEMPLAVGFGAPTELMQPTSPSTLTQSLNTRGNQV